jgi:hypothetical protein
MGLWPDPETAFTVTGIAAGVVLACCGVVDEEQPVIAAVVTTSRRARRDPLRGSIYASKPANATSPAGPMNVRVKPARDRNKWTE